MKNLMRPKEHIFKVLTGSNLNLKEFKRRTPPVCTRA
jgi:hypothetical protein